MSNALNDQSRKSLFDDPTDDRLKYLQALAIQSRGFDPSAACVLRLESMLATASPAELIAKIKVLPWFLQLCPRLHFVEARTRENLGEIDEMRVSVHRMQQCLRALMRTGEGSWRSPYCVTFATDEHDILRVIGEPIRCQQVVECGNRRCDVITAHSGIDVWFDITLLLQRQSWPKNTSSRTVDLSFLAKDAI